LALVALALVAAACSGSALAPPASPQTSPTGGDASQTSLPSPAFTELAVPRPRTVSMLIPFPDARKQEMLVYAEEHYGLHTYQLVQPQAIVEHFTASAVERGVEVSEIRHLDSGEWTPGPHPERLDYNSFADFSDPDGNTWVLQERHGDPPPR